MYCALLTPYSMQLEEISSNKICKKIEIGGIFFRFKTKHEARKWFHAFFFGDLTGSAWDDMM